MKLNFWQWIGIALLIVGVIFFIYDRGGRRQQPRQPEPQQQVDPKTPATQPATQPTQ